MELFAGSVLACTVYRRRTEHLQGILKDTSITTPSPELRARTHQLLSTMDYSLPPYCVFENHGQLQTMLQFSLRNMYRVLFSVVRWRGSVYYKRELLSMPDGGTVALDWAERYGYSTEIHLICTSPVVILHHGLVGDSTSEYIVHLAAHLLSNGFRVVVLVARGCGGLRLTSPEIFAGRRVCDVAYSVQHVKEKYPSSKLFLIGFSLGAALSLQYLAENHEEILRRTYSNNLCSNPIPRASSINSGGTISSLPAANPLTAALCVSPPWDITKNTTSGRNMITDAWMTLLAIPLKLYYLQHRTFLNRNAPDRYRDITLWRLFRARNMGQLDSLLYPTHHRAGGGKYSSLVDYYDDVSPIHSVHRVNTPVIVLSAMDDPVCHHANTPSDPAQVGPGVVVVKTPFGGHLAYPEGIWPKTLSWADRVVLGWFRTFL